MKFIPLVILSSLYLVSCSGDSGSRSEPTPPPVSPRVAPEDDGVFYDAVYEAVETRENANKAWVEVQGVLQIKFTQNTASQGSYSFYYVNYNEPQFVFNTCSGGYSGNFSITSNQFAQEDPNYNVLNPDPTDPDSILRTKTYDFQTTITSRNLDSACRSESDKIISIFKFENGEIVLKSEYREIKMRLKLESENYIYSEF